ncbi:MAG: hypothetical protein AAF127_07610 [Pseudomonadota bacterium]
MPTDPFATTANSLTSPAASCFAITPDDSSELQSVTKALYVGTGGDLVIRPLEGDQDIVLRNTVSGSIIDIRVKAVRATGTSAQDLVGLI